MANDSGIDELIRRATDPASSPESIGEALGPAFAPYVPADRPGAERALRRFAETLGQTPPGPEVAGTIAIACGALVESGLDPRIALDFILDRLERQNLPDALAYVNACRLAAADAPPAQPGPGGLDEGNPPDPVEQHGARVAAQFPHEAQSFRALVAVGAFNLWNWQGLNADGTLRDPHDGADDWIWNEGVPADIALFEGTRIVLLGPPPYPRSWSAGRRFPEMAGSVRVESILTPDEVGEWLGRIAAASSAG